MSFGRRDEVVQKKHQQQCAFELALRHSCFILHPKHLLLQPRLTQRQARVLSPCPSLSVCATLA